jgi:photosystem II CP47 chlorophyll apoprotein
MSCCPSLALSWVVLVYEKGIVKADVPFRKTKSKHNVKQVSVIVKFYGGELEGVSF